jgi:translation initiation factor 3 subunit A
LDRENLRRLHIEQLEAERKELSSRIKTLSRRIDHIERAYRKEEIPLLQKVSTEKNEQDKKHHEEAYQMLLEATKRQHAVNLEGKHRMAKMAEFVTAHRKRIEEAKGTEYREKKAEMEAKIAEEKAKRIAEVKAQKEMEAKLKAEQEKERLLKEEEAERLRQGWLLLLLQIISTSHIHLKNKKKRKSNGEPK